MAELYDALIESIQREDTDQFLERYLQGPEEIRTELHVAFQRLQKLADPARCPAKHLPYLASQTRSHARSEINASIRRCVGRRARRASLRFRMILETPLGGQGV